MFHTEEFHQLHHPTHHPPIHMQAQLCISVLIHCITHHAHHHQESCQLPHHPHHHTINKSAYGQPQPQLAFAHSHQLAVFVRTCHSSQPLGTQAIVLTLSYTAFILGALSVAQSQLAQKAVLSTNVQASPSGVEYNVSLS